jgi:hypothetical protein
MGDLASLERCLDLPESDLKSSVQLNGDEGSNLLHPSLGLLSAVGAARQGHLRGALIHERGLTNRTLGLAHSSAPGATRPCS